MLAQGDEPAAVRPTSSRRRGALLLLAVLVLAAASVWLDRPDAPAPVPARAGPEPLRGVSATAQLVSQDRLRLRLLVEVRITAGPVTGRGGGPSAAQVRLQGISAPGLVARLGDRPVPVLLGYVGRFGNGLEQVVRLPVDVVALGCAEPGRPRPLSLSMSRGTSGSSVDVSVPVADQAEVSSALEALVRRSCRGAGR